VAFSIALGVATLVATQSLRRGIVQGKRDPFSLGELIITNGRANRFIPWSSAGRWLKHPRHGR
jgi:hypothetical protein